MGSLTAKTDCFSPLAPPWQRVAPVGMPSIAFYRCSNLCNGSAVPGRDCFNRSEPFAASYTQEFRRAYRAATSWMDYLVGQLTGELSALGLDSRTIVVFNGE